MKNKIGFPTWMPTKKTLRPSTLGEAKRGSAAEAGTGGFGTLNIVDITLIVFFSIFGAALLAAFVWYAFKFSRGAVVNAKSKPTRRVVDLPVPIYYDEDGA
jgi:hypothetical protein